MRLFLIAVSILIAFNAQGQLSKTEKKLVQYIDSHNDESLKLLKDVININSGSMHFEGVFEVGKIFRAELDALGMETRWVEGKPFMRSGHLVATIRGGKGPHILMIGHLDTVFELESPFQKYELIDENTAKGPGIADMKGGNVIIVQALEALHDAGQLQKMNITVVMTGDEELSGRPLELARKDLIDAAKEADIALGFENGDGDPTTAIVARRSSSGWELNVSGIPAHSSQVFSDKVGAGAIYEASRILNGFYEALAGEEFLTFNPGLILGGTAVDHDKAMDAGTASGKSNVVAQTTIVSGDIRCISPEQLVRAQKAMKKVVAEHRPLTKAAITFGEGYPPFAPTDGNYELLKSFSQVSIDLGFGAVTPVDPKRAGAADISFTSPYIKMGIDGMGMGGADDHTVKETGDLRTLPMQTKRAAVLIYRLANQ